MITGNVVIVIPAYNESDIIEDTIKGLKNINIADKIVVIDDGSTDNTAEIAENAGACVISLEKNSGKGYAMKVAIENINCNFIGFIDGDVGLSSEEFEKLIYPVISNEVDFTIAKFPSPATKGGFGFVKKLAKNGVYKFTGKEVDTSLSGQRVYKKNIVDNLKYIPNDYGIEVAMTIQAINNGYTFREIPVNMKHRFSDRSIKGFKHRGKQFYDILKTLIIMYFRR